ncbi:MAG: glycerate kinase [Tunicatimonas sp.]
MQLVLTPDKFKGSLTAAEVCQIVKRGVKRYDPAVRVRSIPLADGGEGTLDILIPLLRLEIVRTTVPDPLFRPIPACYGMQGDTAYVEMAVASGLPLLKEAERDPLRTTSLGTGELLRHAIERGARRVYLFVGGSATNDAGLGLAQALGYRFLDVQGQELSPVGGNLIRVARIEKEQLLPQLADVEIRVVSDVNNPLYGSQGAAQVYAPQKGATAAAVHLLEQGLTNMADRMQDFSGNDVRNVPGAGAAGGIGAGAVAFLGAQLIPGIATMLDLCQAPPAIAQADLVVSGEGKIDAQTLHGKVVKGVGDVCRQHGVPLNVICGTLEASPAELKQLNVQRAYAVKEGSMTLAEALANTEARVEALAYRMIADFYAS